MAVTVKAVMIFTGSNGRVVYADCLVQNISCKAGEEFL
jgi:type III restriction enzyme